MQREAEGYLWFADRFREIRNYLDEHRNENRDQLARELEKLVFKEEASYERVALNYSHIEPYDVWDDIEYSVNTGKEIRELFNNLKHSCVDHNIEAIEIYLNSLIHKYEAVASKVDYCLTKKRERQRR